MKDYYRGTMMNDVLMIVPTMGTLDPRDNDRFTYIANRILEIYSNYSVEIITSDFEHHKKKYRDQKKGNNFRFTITFLHENEYKKNISIKRLIGHYSFSKRLKMYLNNRKKPDVIYCAVPPLSSARVVASFSKKNNIRMIIDLQDLWPESFTIILGRNVFSKILLYPFAKIADYIYSSADVAFAVSETYAQRIRKTNHKAHIQSIYLGTDLSKYLFSLDMQSCVKPEEEFWIAYVGNLGKSYDFNTMFVAINEASKRIPKSIKVHIMGDGNCRQKVEELARIYHKNTVFHGYLPYDEMFTVLKKCDLAINPIIPGTSSSVINKVSDYAAAGIAVVNTQDSEEYRNLVDEYNVGINTIPGDPVSLANAIHYLYTNQNKRIQMGKNNKELYKLFFDRRKTYIPIIEEMVKKNG